MTITYRDEDKLGDPIVHYIPFKELKSIDNKIWNEKTTFLPLSEIVFGQNIYFYTDKILEG